MSISVNRFGLFVEITRRDGLGCITWKLPVNQAYELLRELDIELGERGVEATDDE